MTEIVYIDRQNAQKMTEKVYKERALRLLYGDSWISRFLRPWLLPSLSKWPWFSALYGRLQKRTASARKIQPFIKTFEIDSSEFLDPVSHFRSFNDFFIRQALVKKDGGFLLTAEDYSSQTRGNNNLPRFLRSDECRACCPAGQRSAFVEREHNAIGHP